MKRLFLLSAALVAATCSFAQKAELKGASQTDYAFASRTVAKTTSQAQPVRVKQCAEMTTQKAIRRTKVTGNWYYPTGGLYMGYGVDGYGYGNSIYVVAPFTDITFVGSREDGQWCYNGKVIEEGKTHTMNYQPNANFITPTLVNQIDSFNIGHLNAKFLYSKDDSYGMAFIWTGGEQLMYPCDDHRGVEENGTVYGNGYMGGSLSSGYLYGSGSLYRMNEDSVEVEYPSIGIAQDYSALASPLNVDTIAVTGISHSAMPMGENDTLIAVLTVGEDDLDTLYCTQADIMPFEMYPYQLRGDTVYEGTLYFTKKEVDDLGMETSAPVTIPDNEEYSIYILGFNKSNTIDFGAEGMEYPDEDENANPGYMMVQMENKVGYSYYTNCSAKIAFIGQFDKAVVMANCDFTNLPEGINMNALRVSTDGKTVTTDGGTEEVNFGAVLVGTANPWFDAEGYENYTLVSDDDTDWITWQVDNSTYADDDSDWYGYNGIACECEPLPAGTSGRMAIVRVEGKGVTSEPFVVLQGDAQMPSAIESVLTATKGKSTRVYNLAGQQMNTNAKGLLIKGGKKVIVK